MSLSSTSYINLSDEYIIAYSRFKFNSRKGGLMKKIVAVLSSLGAAFICAVASAQQVTYNQSCTQVAISSSTPTELTGNLNNQRAFVWAIKVSNLDTAANLCCSQDPSVSCSAGSHHGEIIAASSSGAPYNFLSWIINYIQPWYCKNSSGTASTNAQVCLTSGIR